MKAYAWRTGKIEFGRYVPSGAILVAKGEARKLRQVVNVMSRHAYDGKTLLVPGIPEAKNDDAAGQALVNFIVEVAKRMPKKRNGFHEYAQFIGGRHEHRDAPTL